MAKVKYKQGMRFGQWTLIAFEGKGYWAAQCGCGTKKSVFISHMTSGKSTRCRACYGHSRVTHGMTKTPTYNSWSGMFQRCENKNDARYNQYGGAGVIICPRWRKFENFLEDMGERPKGTSLDRIDPTGGYEKSNCRWATPKQQMNNLKDQPKYTHDGHTLTMKEWSEKTGIPYGRLQSRLYRGWSFERAITTGLVQGQRGHGKGG